MIERTNRIWLPKTGFTVSHVAGDDGYYQVGFPRATRFVDNGNNTVSDLCTGLTWVYDLATLGAPFNAAITWADGLAACEALTYAGYSDWRMPNANDLCYVIDWGNRAWSTALGWGAIAAWASTPADATTAWRVSPSAGNPYSNVLKTNNASYRACLVRGGQKNANR